MDNGNLWIPSLDGHNTSLAQPEWFLAAPHCSKFMECGYFIAIVVLFTCICCLFIFLVIFSLCLRASSMSVATATDYGKGALLAGHDSSSAWPHPGGAFS
ncbi:hypothetical protein ACQJBY_000616 [Aegilops geniculata]